MLTPGMMKREFGTKVSSLVKVWEDRGEDDEDDVGITLPEFLSMTNISFLDGLGTTARRRTVAPRQGLIGLKQPDIGDYAKAGAVSIPMLELYQFVISPHPHNFPQPPSLTFHMANVMWIVLRKCIEIYL
jgi:Spc7 kinetochore protein